MNNIINPLRQMRLNLGKKICEVSNDTGLSQAHISRLERSERRMNMDTLKLFSDYYQCTPTKLMDFRLKQWSIQEKLPDHLKNVHHHRGMGTLPVYDIKCENKAFKIMNADEVMWRPISPINILDKEVWGVHITDNCCAPRYTDKDILFLYPTPDNHLIPNKHIFVCLYTDPSPIRYAFMNFVGWQEDKTVLVCENLLAQETLTIPKENVRSIFRVIGTTEI